MNAVFVAQDKGPSDALRLLAWEINERRDGVFSYLACGRGKIDSEPGSIPMQDAIIMSDFVLCGMSSSAALAREEIKAAELAIRHKIPLGFFSDTFGSWKREWFGKVLPYAAVLFVANAEERTEAQQLVVNVVNAGNPTWERYHIFQRTREEVRAALGTPDDVVLILSPGRKKAAVNILLWSVVAEAIGRVAGGEYDKYQVLLCPHPGDQTPLQIYADIEKYSSVPARIIRPETMSTSEILCGSDLVIEFASSIGIEAACKRIPVIDFFTGILLGNLQEEYGTSVWPLCQSGAAESTFGIQQLAETAYRLLNNPIGRRNAMAKQAEVFPAPPVPGTSVRIMAETIDAIVMAK